MARKKRQKEAEEDQEKLDQEATESHPEEETEEEWQNFEPASEPTPSEHDDKPPVEPYGPVPSDPGGVQETAKEPTAPMNDPTPAEHVERAADTEDNPGPVTMQTSDETVHKPALDPNLEEVGEEKNVGDSGVVTSRYRPEVGQQYPGPPRDEPAKPAEAPNYPKDIYDEAHIEDGHREFNNKLLEARAARDDVVFKPPDPHPDVLARTQAEMDAGAARVAEFDAEKSKRAEDTSPTRKPEPWEGQTTEVFRPADFREQKAEFKSPAQTKSKDAPKGK